MEELQLFSDWNIVSGISLNRKASLTFASAVLNCSLAVYVVEGSHSDTPLDLLPNSFFMSDDLAYCGPIFFMVF
jgi:hypothetical protein